MIVEEVEVEAYRKLVADPYHVFGSGAFNELNKAKVEKVFFLVFKDSKPRLAICGGLRNGEFKSPFSAPFGGFVFLEPELKFQFVDQATDALVHWAQQRRIQKINITLPPSIYDETFITRQINVFFRKGFAISSVDVNHYFPTSKFTQAYVQSMWHNARKNYRASLQNNLSFVQVDTEQDKQVAYDVISKNRAARGFPLRMTWQQVRETIDIVAADFFVVNDANTNAVAAAIVFYAGRAIVQVVYWGDLPEFSNLRTMNYLTYQVFEHYKNKGIRIVDIGPSTENSVPNFGLCDFKESIGCEVSSKFGFSKILQ